MRKIITIVSIVLMFVLGCSLYVDAISYNGDISYTIYDEENNKVESGTLSSSNTRASFNAVTLKDGYIAEFKPDNALGFLAAQDRLLKFKYSMNESGYMTTQMYRYRSVRVAKNQSTHKGTTLKYVTTTTGNYYVQVRNDSGSSKNIYGITFDILYP